jgi:uncharacterized protein (DUF983 family)
MAACPSCNKPISWSKLRKLFRCPSCGRDLVANVTGPNIAALIIWIIADIPLKMMLYALLGDHGYLPIVIRALLSGFLGWAVFAIVVGQFSQVKVGKEHHQSDLS